MPGKILPKQKLIMMVHAGTAESGHGEHNYSLGTNALNGAPVILHEGNHQYWVISWEELLEMAVSAGINEVAHVE